jgi:hypothetical protein
MFGGIKSLPVPDILPTKCPDCGSNLKWQVVEYVDAIIGIKKADHYKAECANGHVHYRDQRGQVVEPAVANLAPDRSEFANSPQGPQPYSGFIEFVKQERAKAEALKAAQAKKAADAAAGGENTAATPAPAAAAAAPGPAAAPAQLASPAGSEAPA